MLPSGYMRRIPAPPAVKPSIFGCFCGLTAGARLPSFDITDGKWPSYAEDTQMRNSDGKIERIKRIYRIVSRHAARLAGPCVEADDLTQMTIEKALKSKALPEKPSCNWLKAATKNAMCDILRKVYREREHRDFSYPIDSVRLEYYPDKNVTIPSVVFEPSDPYLYCAVRHALDQLSGEQRRAFILYADGFSYEEIAQLTDSKLNTVRTRLHFARRSLQRNLASHC